MDAAGRAGRMGAAVSIGVLRHTDRTADVGRGSAPVRARPQRANGRAGRWAADCALAAVRLLRPGSAHVYTVDVPGFAGWVRAAQGDDGGTTMDDGRWTIIVGAVIVYGPWSIVCLVAALCRSFRSLALHPLLRRISFSGVRRLFHHRLAGFAGAGRASLADAGPICPLQSEHPAALPALAAGDAQPLRGRSLLLAGRVQDRRSAAACGDKLCDRRTGDDAGGRLPCGCCRGLAWRCWRRCALLWFGAAEERRARAQGTGDLAGGVGTAACWRSCCSLPGHPSSTRVI